MQVEYEDENENENENDDIEEEGSSSIQIDPYHVILPFTTSLPEIQLLTSLLRPSYNLFESFYSKGKFKPKSSIPSPPIDLVYLYVNGSSELFQAEFDSRVEVEGLSSLKGRAKRWRENGELRGAIRSGISSLGESLGKVHVVSADFQAKCKDLEDDQAELENCRIGQIPGWLNWESQNRLDERDGMRLKWHLHSEIFRLPMDQGRLPEEVKDEFKSEEKWKELALPNFNSFEIETRIGFIDGLADHFILSNDDMFILSPMSRSDFHHPLLGPVIRLDPGLTVRPVLTPDLKSTSGEWGGLQHASVLLSSRFPKRERMYMHHMPKSLSKALVHEASIMFSHALSVSSTRGLRGSKRGEADVEMAWLVTHLRIERWREALLWVWAVAKLGGENGVWDDGARDEVKRVLGLNDGMKLEEDGEVEIFRGDRTTLRDIEGISNDSGWEMPLHSEYIFSSFDGHLPHDPDKPSKSCHLSLFTCFPSDWLTNTDSLPATEIFTHLAFVEPGCGDCMIDALIAASGETGLEAFLPSPKSQFSPSEDPMLPLTTSWEKTDFSLKNVVRQGQDVWTGERKVKGKVSLRRWSIKLLSRYSYVYATTPSRFSQIHSVRQLQASLASIDSHPELAMACLNDDQPDKAVGDVRGVFGEWMFGRWGGNGPWNEWERDWAW
ncbi:hypothetical protein TREMEDRAFT_67606 [Tremella mesenterica DSM 1558]|uniref:uncharacterized protein n=1 Tax=Tremella mesenterica (strain ATCC 24925 / CBS 8224 / DSM 1558 / NBRC 9311 / NRRL Y-6157 / RJB 2259-6 / UBC 559-6) TaxID=578456 RepID=UPI0003F498D0|nr:uncharacterized protein TREMEDRAFT_67606 [Tremella mesenterica DSM 1558]EIW71167.1 hypothetical protein TREMEDRAFT_67606 [Tremella mesenterica DSM 1558]